MRKTTWITRYLPGSSSVTRTNIVGAQQVRVPLELDRERDRTVVLHLSVDDAQHLAHRLLFQVEQAHKQDAEMAERIAKARATGRIVES